METGLNTYVVGLAGKKAPGSGYCNIRLEQFSDECG